MPTLTADACWNAIVTRDTSFDGLFFVAVHTTGIYCRPGCPSRTPKRENVSFFGLPAAAEAAGFRPCKRCHPQLSTPRDPSVQMVQAVAAHIHAHIDQPDRLDLKALGRLVGYDPQHVQRTFRAVLGITPKHYAEAIRLKAFKRELRAGTPVLDAALQAGFGSAGHLYEKVTDQLGMTPSTYRKGGQGMTITYHNLESAFGVLLLAATERGLCAAELHTSPESAEAALAAEFPNAQRVRASDDAPLTAWGAQVMAHVVEGEPLDVPLDVQATAFQWRVWQALQAIPRGQTRTYREVADALGMPTGARAVASACASNRVALVIPCHRVVGASGALTGYKWGVERKRALLDAERGERGLW